MIWFYHHNHHHIQHKCNSHFHFFRCSYQHHYIQLCREGRPWATARRSISIEKEVSTTKTLSALSNILFLDVPNLAPCWWRWKRNWWKFLRGWRLRCGRIQALQTLLHQQEVTVENYCKSVAPIGQPVLFAGKHRWFCRTSEGPDGRGEGRMHPLPEEEETVRISFLNTSLIFESQFSSADEKAFAMSFCSFSFPSQSKQWEKNRRWRKVKVGIGIKFIPSLPMPTAIVATLTTLTPVSSFNGPPWLMMFWGESWYRLL